MLYKYKLVVDKLEITYIAPDGWNDFFEAQIQAKKSDEPLQIKFDDLILERKESRKYKFEFNVFYYDGYNSKTLIGLIYWESFNVNRKDVYFSYTNKALYDDKEFLLHGRFYIGDALGLTFKQISKLDIALDSNINIVKRFYKIFRNENYSVIINGKKTSDAMNELVPEVDGHYFGSRESPYKHKTFHIRNGSKSKDLQIIGYDKSLEIEEKSGKTYIEDEDGFCGIHRLEVRCGSHKQIAKILNDLKWSEEDLYIRLSDEESRLLLFENISRRLIRFTQQRKSYSLTDLIFK